MRLHARRRGIELTHRCRQVTESDFDDFDLIIGMDSANISNLRAIAPSPEAESKIHAMSEYFSPSARHDHVPTHITKARKDSSSLLDLLDDACRNLYHSLTQS